MRNIQVGPDLAWGSASPGPAAPACAAPVRNPALLLFCRFRSRVKATKDLGKGRHTGSKDCSFRGGRVPSDPNARSERWGEGLSKGSKPKKKDLANGCLLKGSKDLPEGSKAKGSWRRQQVPTFSETAVREAGHWARTFLGNVSGT